MNYRITFTHIQLQALQFAFGILLDTSNEIWHEFNDKQRLWYSICLTLTNRIKPPARIVQKDKYTRTLKFHEAIALRDMCHYFAAIDTRYQLQFIATHGAIDCLFTNNINQKLLA